MAKISTKLTNSTEPIQTVFWKCLQHLEYAGVSKNEMLPTLQSFVWFHSWIDSFV